MAKKVAKKKAANKKKSTRPVNGKAKAKVKAKVKAAASSLEPSPVSTGKGLSAMEIGRDLVTKFNAGKMGLDDIGHFASDIVSCEGMGVNMEWRGRKAVDAKNAWWGEDHVVHGASAEGPYIGSTGFSVKFTMDVETKSTGKRESMTEVGVYGVRNGKIIREEFMYLLPTS